MTSLLIGSLIIVVLGINLMMICRALSPTATETKIVNAGAIIAAAGALVFVVGGVVFAGIPWLRYEPHYQDGYAIASLGVSVVILGTTAIIRAKGHQRAKGIEKWAWGTIGFGTGLFIIFFCILAFVN
jgi:membrane protein CcdC involved in cytochrome C biogenesis